MPEVARFRCPGCSAELEYDPKAASLKCPYCGNAVDIPKSGLDSVREHPFEEHDDPSTFRKVSDTALQITCQGCGAIVSFEPPKTAGACSFCAAPMVAQPKAADPLLAPDGLLPFSVPKDAATQSVKKWLSTRWFAPNALKTLARPEGIHGVYLPFWTFDAHTYSRYQGERGIYYYEERREGNQIRRVRYTRWSPVSGDIELNFDDIVIPASRAVDSNRLRQLEPWGLEEVTPYEQAYLSGFEAQQYQVTLDEGLEASKRQMESEVRSAVHREIGGDEQRIHHLQTEFSNITFKHLLLPVWLGAYRFQGKVFQVAVNARTSEVQGERPYSAIKIALFVIFLLFVVWVLSIFSE